MPEFRIVFPPSAFVVDAEDPDHVTPAPAVAAAWLAEQCAGGFTPINLVARGNDARVVLSGGQDGAAIVLSRVAP
jgi:hypothetical protein